MRSLRALLAATLAAAGVVTLAIAEDKASRTVDAGGLTFEAPGAWKASTPSSSMRKAQLTIAPAEGDTDPAELVVFAFPGGAGTVEANVARWRAQFKDVDGNAPTIESRSVKGRNTPVTRVEVAGRYTDPFAKTGPKDHYRLFGAIVETDAAAYFLKMTGPDKTMLAAREAFDTLVTTLALKK